MDLFEQAESIIKDIARVCPKTAEKLTGGLDCLRGVSCAADGEGKDDAFTQARALLEEAALECPARAKQIEALWGLLEDGASVKCSGGG